MNFGQANQQALVTQYGYDEVGNRISQTDANQHTTKYVYDQLGRRISRMLPAGQSESYSYDAVGNLQQKIDFNGKTTAYAYDSNNRLQSKTPDPSFNAPAVGFTYSATGKRLTMSDVSGVTTYTYDPQTDRLLQKQTPEGTLNYTYDAAGNLKSLQSQNQGGASDAYTYDADHRLATVTDASGQTTYAYDNVGNLQSFAYPNGVATAYTYDSLNRLTQMGAGKNGTLQANYVYTLGAAGNRLSVAELSGRTVNYGYDSLYRLTSETISADPHGKNGTGSYTYDSVGNRLTLNSSLPPAGMMNYSYDADDRLGSDQYDPNGNTISSAGTTSTYDFENHLVSKGGVTIVYDGDGNRVSETVAGVTTQYLVDTQNPTGYAQVVDEIQNGSVVRRYSWGLELISKLETGNSKRSFYGFDGHGSVRFLTDSNGTVTDTYDYDAFGNLIASTGSTPNNYLFAGEQFDPALGLYYNRARYLNTTTGRFWSMDTYEGRSEEPGSLHKYLYVDANPVNMRDVSGHGVLAAEEAEAETIEQEDDAELFQLYRQVSAQISRNLLRSGLVLYSGIVAFFIAAVIPDPDPQTQSEQDEPEDSDSLWLYRTGNTIRVDPPRILGYNRTPGQSFDMQVINGNVSPVYPWPDGASTFSNSAMVPGTDPLWRVQKGAVYSQPLIVIADGSDAIPPGPRGRSHHTIAPEYPMSAADFLKAFNNLPWIGPMRRK